ncbi:glycoside hydrolase family 2 protein [Weissella sagaensis]|jgi:beta-galactosidase/beta-glucuronidase|uniref:glycoside hydrolase family 2 protein n=1 Tax=Weissella sagaensis TaxID=2559928 RepID=UPI0012388C16|nr:sugar-binding domain-containing protein [Weissella sagaensis]KAA8433933.1 glycoside hydrolase family 2 [Weissella paramesenteroides]KAA8438297.1 glycoside hydrolase family 2 [Weissella paramesenteroides]MBU7568156.1 beta galactosidase jelly roll domain-containing protein [Weissella hellenica]
MYRTEYPQPQFQRENWTNLNGSWDFDFDDQNQGIKDQWYQQEKLTQKIEVPFAYQTQLSGIDDQSEHSVVWYQRHFQTDQSTDEVTILHFGAVDFKADVWIDGQHVGTHSGGHTSFSFDITNFVKDGANHVMTVRADDPIRDEELTRGKQNWTGESTGIWYTNTTGIWQTVWLEKKPVTNLASVKYVTDIDKGIVEISGEIDNFIPGTGVTANIKFGDDLLTKVTIYPEDSTFEWGINILGNHIFRMGYHNEGWLWTPEHPNLFTVDFETTAPDAVTDKVSSYFGMRKIHTANGMTYLNNRPYYQKLVLNQGYWPEGLLTAPSDESFKKDISLAKEMGFNGARIHQKVEDPRYLYWADKMGFICWGECAAAPVFTQKAEATLYKEWLEIIERDYNHPSIVTWVPINESWGVPQVHIDRQQQHFTQAMYHLIHSLDTTRLVQSNDGWAQTETDICAVHNYAHGTKDDKETYDYYQETLHSWESIIRNPPVWDIFAEGFKYQGQPILLTEFGGIGYNKQDADKGWGYTGAKSDEEFISEYQRIMKAVAKSHSLNGIVYTQLTDTEQEVNGLLTVDRQPKVDPEVIKKANEFFIRAFVDAPQKDIEIADILDTDMN